MYFDKGYLSCSFVGVTQNRGVIDIMSKQQRIESGRHARATRQLVPAEKEALRDKKPADESHVVLAFGKKSFLEETIFGQIGVGEVFQICRTETSPKEGVSPIFTKTELASVDLGDGNINYNCTYSVEGSTKYGWLPNLIRVSRVI